jgi:hypothetical protein
VYLRHGAKGNETNQGIWWQQAEAHNYRVFEGLQRIGFLAGIDNKEENGR